MKQHSLITILLAVLMSMIGVKAFAHDIAVANKDGYTIYYKWINDNTELAVTYQGSYEGEFNEYSGNVEIPESVEYEGKIYSVTSIGDNAFSCCSSLTSVTIPHTITSIGSKAFRDCNGLTAVYITDLKAWCNISFAGLILYGIGDSQPLCYAHHLYMNGKEITELEIPEGVTSINRLAFAGCSELTSLTIPSSVVEIGIYAFAGCLNLNKVIIKDLEAWCSILFSYYNGDFSNPLSYAHHLFQNGEEIRELIIPNSVININDYAFVGCSSFTSIVIPNSVTTIGNSVFSGCTSLKTIDIPNSVTEIGSSSFSGCTDLNSVTIGNSVTSIGESAFYGCTGLTSVSIGEKVTSLGESAFYGCTGLTSLTIGEKVTSIGNSAFYGCSGLITVDIPRGITSIRSYTFSNCSGLLSVTLPDGVTQIGDAAFSECSSLISVNIPKTVNSIGERAFSGCSNLAIDLIIPEGVTQIPGFAFHRCSKITSVTIPKSLISIGWDAFGDCKGLKGVNISDIEAWCRILFDQYYWDSNPLYYAHNLILNGDTIRNLVIPEGVTSINKGAFYGCSGLTSLTLPDNITSIDEHTFYGCSGLKSILFPETLTSFRKNAFQNCSSIEQISIPATIEFIYQEVFAGCDNLKSVRSLATAPPFLYDNSFSNYDIPLYVPQNYIDSYKAANGWKLFSNVLSIDAAKHSLTYIVDGEVYKTYELYEGEAITPEPEPTKDGYDFSGWSTIPSTMPAEDVTITGTFTLIMSEDEVKITSAGQTTWCSAYDLDFTDVEGLKAYIASGYHRTKGTIWLTRVKEVPAGEGILLIGDPGDYKVPHKSTTAYYANLMVGTIKAKTINETDGEYTNYYLSNGSSGIGFYKVNGSVEIKANRAYLPLLKNTTSGSRGFIGLDFDDGEEGTTGISEAPQRLAEPDVYYNLQGQRVDNPSKGLYIKNGRKIIVR